MIDSTKYLERLLQRIRFKKVIPLLKGSVLDFGGNKGELKQHVSGDYTLTNYDHSAVTDKKYDTIVALAVIEHIEVADVFVLFGKFKSTLNPDGKVCITTPSRMGRPLLEILACLHALDKENIKEHKHYWKKRELYELASKNGFQVKKYNRFLFGFNQFLIMEHDHNVCQ